MMKMKKVFRRQQLEERRENVREKPQRKSSLFEKIFNLSSFFLSIRQTPIEETTVNYPSCRVETIENLPGYICERQIDGQTKQFVFRIDKNNLIQCGDFVDGKINGNGYTFVFEESKPSSHQCGDHVDGFLHGFASFHSYEQKDLQIGHFLVSFVFFTSSIEELSSFFSCL